MYWLSSKQPPQPRHSGIDAIPILRFPTDTGAGSSNNAQPASDPQGGNHGRDTTNDPPPPLPPHGTTLSSLGDVLARETEILGGAGDEVPTRQADKDGVEGVGEPRVVRDAVGEEPQPDARAAPLDLVGYDALHEHVRHEHRVQHVPGRRGRAERRVGNLAALGVRFGAVPFGGQAAPVEAQRHAGQDVCDDGGEDHQRLEREGLVVRSGQEEVAVAFGRGPREQRDQRRVGVVHR